MEQRLIQTLRAAPISQNQMIKFQRNLNPKANSCNKGKMLFQIREVAKKLPACGNL